MNHRYAISDIHGNAKQFLELLDYVDPDPEELVICGDLVNRGLDAWGVYVECQALLKEGASIVWGNHDLAHKANYDRDPSVPDISFRHEDIGGLQTQKSIELAQMKHGHAHVHKILNYVWDRMEFFIEDDDYIFVHAAINPRIPYMEDQKVSDLLTGHPDWKNPNIDHAFDQTIVFGHTPTVLLHRDIEEEDMTVWYSPRRRKLGIDTGAGFYKKLSMVDLEEGKVIEYNMLTGGIGDYKFRYKSPRKRTYY
ncbi:metallophosphoesterase (plasmid) [Paenibacillus sp. EC2-1]|uniref:metallophosphoesterase n=1 Tax=Paenibacillus sp. EC2-1 TaxID=3388665 RepID=UPI003BEF47D6